MRAGNGIEKEILWSAFIFLPIDGYLCIKKFFVRHFDAASRPEP
jgi:hypothetical protein